MPGEQEARTVVFAGEDEIDQARQLDARMTRESVTFAVDQAAGEPLRLPPELSDLIERIVRLVATGATVTVGSMPQELTTTTAAKELGISRPTLMSKIKNGEIPAHKVGSHTRLRTADVLEYKRARMGRQKAALEELRRLEDD